MYLRHVKEFLGKKGDKIFLVKQADHSKTNGAK
jgi:hypothetical protein